MLQTTIQVTRSGRTFGAVERASDPTLSFDQPAILVRMALERGLLDEAEEAIAGLIAEDDEDAEAWVLRGVAALLRGDNERACASFAAAADRGAEARTTALGRVMALFGLGRHEEAWPIVARLRTRHGDDAEVLHWLLRIGCATERWNALAQHLASYLEERPEDHSARFALAGVHVRCGDLIRARSEHEILRRVVPAFDGLGELAAAIRAPRGGRS
jgi:tetratricopeptide (TPR) repeat protein